MLRNKSVVITGGAGFVGTYLTRLLSEMGYQTYAIIRPNSKYAEMVKGLNNVDCVELDLFDMSEEDLLSIPQCDFFIHLAWGKADRYDYKEQITNTYITLRMVDMAVKLGCKRFVGIGSQAEYGIVKDLISEDKTQPIPVCGYGMAKVAACYLSQKKSRELGIEWVWGRIFSVYGKYEPPNRLLPYIISCIKERKDMTLSSCSQYWDFIHGSDVADAIMAMAERGRDGEIYNIADGRYRKLKGFVSDVIEVFNYEGNVYYGDDPTPFVSLKPSVDKIKTDTGWSPKIDFKEGIRDYLQ